MHLCTKEAAASWPTRISNAPTIELMQKFFGPMKSHNEPQLYFRTPCLERGLSQPSPNGRPRAVDDRRSLHLMFKVLRSGMQWRELECEVNYTTVMRRMHAWSARGVFAHAHRSLLQTYKKRMACPSEQSDTVGPR